MSATKQFNRDVDFLSTSNAVDNSSGAVYIAGGLSVAKDSYIAGNMNITGNLTVGNLTVLGTTTYSSSESTWTTFSPNIAFTSGNVGINTTSPSFDLDVNGTINATNEIITNSTITNVAINAGNITSTTITNGNFINITTSTLRVSGNISAGSSNVTLGSLAVGNISAASSVSTIGTLMINTGIIGALSISGNISAASSISTIGTLVTNNASIGTVSISGNISAGSSFATFGSVITNIITAVGIVVSTQISTSNIKVTNVTVANLISTNVNSGALNVSGGNLNITAGAITFTTAGNTAQITQTVGGLLTIDNSTVSGQINIRSNNSSIQFYSGSNFGTLLGGFDNIGDFSVNNNLEVIGTSSLPNLVTTNGTITNLSNTNLTSTNLLMTNASISSLRGTNVTLNNLLVTVGNLTVSGIISSANVLHTNASITNLAGTLVSGTNLLMTNASIGTITGTQISGTNLLMTNASITNLRSTLISGTNLVMTNITSNSVFFTNASIDTLSSGNMYVSGNMTIGGNLLVGGSVVSVNVTSVNLIENNISTGSLNVSGNISAGSSIATIGTLLSTTITGTLISSTNLVITNASIASMTNASITNLRSTTATIPNIINTNITSTSLVITANGSIANLTSTTATIPNIINTNATISNIMSNSISISAGNLSLYAAPSLVTTIKQVNTSSGIQILTGNSVGNGVAWIEMYDAQLNYGALVMGAGTAGVQFRDSSNTTYVTFTKNLWQFSSNIATSGIVTIGSSIIASGSLHTLGNLITNSGNIGIGRTSPLARLHLGSNNTYNNILIEAGATADGINVGYSAINFNGYYSGGEQRIDATKTRWRIYVDQRGTDVFGLDNFDGTRRDIIIISSAGNIGITGSLSSASLQITNQGSIANLISTNATINNLVVTVGNLTVSGIISSANVLHTNASITNLVGTSVSGTNLLMTNASINNLSCSSLNTTNAIHTNISTNSFNSAFGTMAGFTLFSGSPVLNIQSNTGSSTIHQRITFTTHESSRGGGTYWVDSSNASRGSYFGKAYNAGSSVFHLVYQNTTAGDTLGSHTSTTTLFKLMDNGFLGLGLTGGSPSVTLQVEGTIGSTYITTGILQVGLATISNVLMTNVTASTLTTTLVSGTNLLMTNASLSNLTINNFTSNNLITNNIILGVSSLYSGSFAAVNNQVAASAVTGLLFNSSNIVYFTATVSISIVATTNLYQVYTLYGNFTASGWTLLTSYVGDTSGVVFSINSSTGQVLYTSTSVAGFTSSTFRYSVNQFTASGTYTSLLGNTVGNYILNTIQVSSTENAVYGSNTGALNVQGGATIAKSLVIGNTSGNLTSNGSLSVGQRVGSLYGTQNSIMQVCGPSTSIGNTELTATMIVTTNDMGTAPVGTPQGAGSSIGLGARSYNFGGGNFQMVMARISGVQSFSSNAFFGGFGVEVNNNGLFTNMLYIDSGGTGIKTTAPLATLDVNGTLLVRNRASMGVSCPNTIVDTNDSLYLENITSGGMNYTQLHLVYNDVVSGNAYISINKAGVADGMGNTIQGLNIFTNSNLPIRMGANNITKLTIHQGTVGNIGLGNNLGNRKLVLYESNTASNHEFLGFGVNSGELRYQVGAIIDSHNFYSGTSPTSSTLLMSLGSGSNTLDVKGKIASNSVPLPTFNNGTFSSGTAIPINFTSGSFNVCELKIRLSNTNSSIGIILSGQALGGGGLSALETLETYSFIGGTTVYYNAGDIMRAADSGVNHLLCINICKGGGGGASLFRNEYNITGTYTWIGIGSTRVAASGHFNTGTLASLVLTASVGGCSGTYSSVHYY